MTSYRGGGKRRGGVGRRVGRLPININNLSCEQGKICSLKESFGFIHCAERPNEIFFHYSELTNCHPDDLQIDTEIEFKVGTSGTENDKLAAYSVKCLEKGTVVWEIEEREGRLYQGIVERPCLLLRGSHGDRDGGKDGKLGSQTDGSIRIVEPRYGNNGSLVESNDYLDSNEIEEKEIEKVRSKQNKNGPLVRLRARDYYGMMIQKTDSTFANQNSERHNDISPSRFFRGDLVEFRIILDRRTKQKFATQITLLQSERERKRIEKDKQLLENATIEEGIVVSLNKGFGFLKSNRRRGDVYFHYSQLIIPGTDGDGNNFGDFELKKGQEVKFLVVTEVQNNSSSNKSNNSGNSNIKVSARQIQCLPDGSVVFHTVESKGVKGVVIRVPQPPSPGSKTDDSKWGRVRLIEQKFRDGVGENKNDIIIADSAGCRDNILLHFSDAPGGVFTYQNHRNQTINSLWIHDGDILLFDVVKEIVDGSYRVIPTLHRVGLGGSVVDPNTFLNANHHHDESGSIEQPAVRLVSMSMVGRAEGVIHTMKPDYGFIHFAERPVDVHFKTYDVMPSELQADIRRNMGFNESCVLEEHAAVQFDICAHGNIATIAHRGRRRGLQQARENIRGQRLVILPKSAVTLEKAIEINARGMIKSINPRHPYSGVIELEKDTKTMTIDERHPIVAKMITSFLEESSSPNGRKSIVFRDTLGMNDDIVVTEMIRLKGQGMLECSRIPVPGIAPHSGRIRIRRVEKEKKIQDIEVECSEVSMKYSPNMERSVIQKGKESNSVIRNLRFDKSSLDEVLRDDIPPSPGDFITCDVIQSRRSGKIKVRNLQFVARNSGGGTHINPKSTRSTRLGVVKEVVARRHFGFISVFDENSSKSEMLFFHLPKGTRFVRGNEVKFDITVEGSKSIATNVESVRKGTIPSIPSENACLGYVLMEPSHTTLSNTPIRKLGKAVSDSVGNGRWSESDDGIKTTSKQEMIEDGCILLLEDKTGMFQKTYKAKKKRSESVDSAVTSGDISADGVISISSEDGVSIDDELTSDDECQEDDSIVSVLSRLNYKNGSIAIHGTGVASSMDGSNNPKRGDLVSFIKGRKPKTVRDVRIVKREAAFLQRGRLENIRVIQTFDKNNTGEASFIVTTEKREVYNIDLAEVISCDASILKHKEQVEGIVHEGKVYGLCRTSDLYLTSKLFGGTGKNRERPKLNLTVKKDRGGTIMAQSMMAKGPDGSIGFKTGWTNRLSPHACKNNVEQPKDENADEENVENRGGGEKHCQSE